MVRELQARFSQGKLEPLESLDLDEGEEITIIVKERGREKRLDGLTRAAGAWAGTLDFDAYVADLYASRRQPSREVEL